MGGVIGFIIYFWIFEIGGMVIGRIMGFIDTNSVKSIALFFVIFGAAYVAFYFIKRMGDRKRYERKAAEAAQKEASRQQRHHRKKR